MAQAEAFESPYLFVKSDVVVVLRHALEKNLRHADDKDEVDPDGAFGKKARWIASVRDQDGMLQVQFKNQNTDGFLRIKADKIDCAGKGGKFTWFRVHRQNVGIVKLESVEHEGQYLAVNKNGIKIGKGGPWCRFHIYREGVKPPFSIPYYFGRKKTVVIEHRDLKHVRVNGADSTEVNSNGGKGEFAQFEAEPSDGGAKVTLKSLKSGKYLRIRNDGRDVDCGGHGGALCIFRVKALDHPNQVTLESDKHPGNYLMLAPAKESLKVGDGKNKRCFFTFYRND